MGLGFGEVTKRELWVWGLGFGGCGFVVQWLEEEVVKVEGRCLAPVLQQPLGLGWG